MMNDELRKTEAKLPGTEKKRNMAWVGVLCLLITTVIWGSAFVAQSMGSESLPPMAFTAARSLIGAMAVLPVALLSMHKEKKAGENPRWRTLLLGGCLCGAALMVASALQQAGIATSTAGKAGFITVLYVVLVPIGGLLLGHKVHWPIWPCVAVALGGTYLLSVGEGFSVAGGDLLLLGCAIGYTVQILLISHFTARVNAVMLSCIQLASAGLLAIAASLVMEQATFAQWLECLGPILYVGVLSSGVAYTLQIVAQKYLQPTVATLLMSLESVFAALSGWLILGESLSPRELIGCVLVFAAALVAQLFGEKKETA